MYYLERFLYNKKEVYLCSSAKHIPWPSKSFWIRVQGIVLSDSHFQMHFWEKIQDSDSELPVPEYVFRNILHELQLLPLVIFCQLVADLSGGKAALRT